MPAGATSDVEVPPSPNSPSPAPGWGAATWPADHSKTWGAGGLGRAAEALQGPQRPVALKTTTTTVGHDPAQTPKDRGSDAEQNDVAGVMVVVVAVGEGEMRGVTRDETGDGDAAVVGDAAAAAGAAEQTKEQHCPHWRVPSESTGAQLVLPAVNDKGEKERKEEGFF